jgi:hypothetical protein
VVVVEVVVVGVEVVGVVVVGDGDNTHENMLEHNVQNTHHHMG